MDAGTGDTQTNTTGVVRLYGMEGTQRMASDLHSGWKMLLPQMDEILSKSCGHRRWDKGSRNASTPPSLVGTLRHQCQTSG